MNPLSLDVQFIEPPHFSIFAGIPILEQAQNWFEDLWNWITKAAYDAVAWLLDQISTFLGRWNPETGRIEGGLFGWIWASLEGVASGILSFLGGLWDAINAAFGWISDTIWGWVDGALRWISDSFRWVAAQMSAVGSWIVEGVKGVVAGVGEGITGFLDGLSTWLGDSIEWLGGAISDGVSWVAGEVKTMFDGAVGIIGEWILGALEGMATALGNALQGLWNWISVEVPKFLAGAASFINDAVIQPILGALGWVFDRLKDAVQWVIDSVTALFKGHSPIKPEDALPLGIGAVAVAVVGGGLGTTIVDLISTKVVGTGLDLRALGSFVTQVINPQMFIGAVLGVLIGVGVRSPLTQFYRKQFRPEIPDVKTATSMLWRGTLTEDQYTDVVARWGFGDPFDAAYLDLTKEIPGPADLIRMVVREAFLPEMVVEAPPVFAEYMAKQGFAKEWSDRHWTAHFIPIALRQAYDNLWRGLWDKKQFMFALHIADIHPMWREDIYNVAFRPPGVRELGYGYDTGLYTVEDIVEYRRWGGLSPEDAEKAGKAMVAYRTEAEREALRREALADYVAGLDDEAELRDNLAQIGGRPEIIELWVARANYRLERDLILDLVKVVITDFVKRWSTEDELRQDLIELGVVPDRREVMIREAKARRLKAKKADAAEKHKLLTAAKIAKGRELGLIGDAEFIDRHIKAGYLEDDAELLLAIELTPRPVTPEEIERRKKTITSRLARAQRRWEARLARIQGHIELTALQLEDTTVMKDEALDVLDAQIAVYDELIEMAPEERIPLLQERRKVVVQRRELTEVRWASRIRKLTEQHTSLLEEKALMERHRDEELGEYEGELELLGEVAG